MNADQRTSSVRSAFASMAGGYVSVAKPADGARVGKAQSVQPARTSSATPARSAS